MPANSASATIWVTPIDDRVFEGDETVELTLQESPSYSLDASSYSASVSIRDNEPVVSISATGGVASESGGNTAQSIISRSVVTSRPLYVRYALTGSAKNGIDYTRLSGRATIPAGQSSTAITITPRYDAAIGVSRTVTATLLWSPYYVIGAANSVTFTIID